MCIEPKSILLSLIELKPPYTVEHVGRTARSQHVQPTYSTLYECCSNMLDRDVGFNARLDRTRKLERSAEHVGSCMGDIERLDRHGLFDVKRRSLGQIDCLIPVSSFYIQCETSPSSYSKVSSHSFANRF